ncbi:MAG: hypothetical protein QXX95_06380 [Nitrososphaerales archaeon]
MAYEVISKAIGNKRNYRLSRLGLECNVEDSVFTMNHYGTPILKVDLYEGKVLGYGGYSLTDSSYINHALKEISELYGLDNNFHCRHSRRFNKIWLEDSEGNLYDNDMQLLDKDEVSKKDKEFEARVKRAIKVWERRVKKGEIAGRIDEDTVKPKRISHSDNEGTVYQRLDSDLKTIEAYVLPQSSLDESCWLSQFRGLDACYECETLGKEDGGGGYKFLHMVLGFYALFQTDNGWLSSKFLHMVLGFYGFRYPEIFLCEYQSKDPSKPRIFRALRK